MKHLQLTCKSIFLIVLFFINSAASFSQSPDDQMNEVQLLVDNGKIKKAIKLCDKVIEANPNFVVAYVNKSYLLVDLKKYDEALTALNDGLAANKTDSFLYHERGLLYQSYGMNDHALRDYNLGIKFAENDSVKNSVMISKSVSRSRVRDFQGAYDILLECYDFDSTNMATLNNLAVVCDEVGKPEMVPFYLTKVIEADSLFVPGYVNLGFHYQSKEEYEKSIFYFDKALSIRPDEAFSYNNRAYSKLKMGDLDGALSDVNKSIELYPGNAYAYRNRALIYIEMDKISKACEDIQLALDWSFTEQYGNEMIQLQRKYCK